MTPHATRLLQYTMTQGGMDKETAGKWLDNNVPGWQERNEPVARRCYDENPSEQED